MSEKRRYCWVSIPGGADPISREDVKRIRWNDGSPARDRLRPSSYAWASEKSDRTAMQEPAAVQPGSVSGCPLQPSVRQRFPPLR